MPKSDKIQPEWGRGSKISKNQLTLFLHVLFMYFCFKICECFFQPIREKNFKFKLTMGKILTICADRIRPSAKKTAIPSSTTLLFYKKNKYINKCYLLIVLLTLQHTSTFEYVCFSNAYSICTQSK